jgi:hypothetical protein
MSHSSKVLAAAVGTAFLAMVGCASQGSGAASPANLPNNCQVVAQNACKGKASCKGAASPAKKHHAKAAKAKAATTTTETTNSEESK